MTQVLEKIPQTRQQKRKLGRDAKKVKSTNSILILHENQLLPSRI